MTIQTSFNIFENKKNREQRYDINKRIPDGMKVTLYVQLLFFNLLNCYFFNFYQRTSSFIHLLD